MKLYLAAAFSRQEEIKLIAVRLESKGLTITSRWLEVKKERLENAFMDVEDVRRADILVRFTDTVQSSLITMTGYNEPYVPARLISGARHFETGLAWERGIPIIVVGGKQNIFDEFPNITHVDSVYDLEKILGVA
jgi:hypothetical protein